MKQNISKILVAIVIMSLVLTACGPAATPTPQVIEVTRETTKVVPGESVNVVVTATNAPEPTAAPKPKGTINVWMWKSAREAIVNSGVFADFQKEYPDIQVEWLEIAASDLYQKLPLALTAGTGAPDVALVESSNLASMVALGGLTDLTDRVAPYVEVMNQYKWPDASADGKYYAMPWDSGPVVLYYRRDVFKKAGLSDDPAEVTKMVATWDSYLEVCKTIKAKTGDDCFANNKANSYARLYEMMLWQQGLGYYKGDTITIDSPENLATLEKMGEFWTAGLTSDQLEWTEGWYGELASLDKPIATIVIAAWMGIFLKTWIASGTAGLWGVAEMPAMQAGQVRAANEGGSNLVIPDQSQNKDAAWAFAQFVCGREKSQLKMFAYSDFLPSLETTYEDAMFIEPDSFFANQAPRQLYVDVVKKIPQATVYGPNYPLFHSLLGTALGKYASGTPAKDALKEAADTARAQTGLK